MISGIGNNLVSRLASKPVSRLNRQTGKHANRHTKRAFTLIEALLAVTILAIGMVGILRAYAAAVNALQAGQCSLDVLYLLKEKMADIELRAIEEGGLIAETDRGKFGSEYKDFRWESEIETLDFGIEELEDRMNEVSVTVINERVKPIRKFTLVTYEDKRQEGLYSD